VNGCVGLDATFIDTLCDQAPNIIFLEMKFLTIANKFMKKLVRRCTKLVKLDIQACVVKNSFLRAISNCTSLKHLDLRDCINITGCVDYVLQNCLDLMEFRIRSDHVVDYTVEPLLEFGGNIEILDLQSCKSLSFEMICELLRRLGEKRMRLMNISEMEFDVDMEREVEDIVHTMRAWPPLEVILSKKRVYNYKATWLHPTRHGNNSK